METIERNAGGLQEREGIRSDDDGNRHAKVPFHPLEKPKLSTSEVEIAAAHIMDRFDRFFGATAESENCNDDDDQWEARLRAKYRIPDGVFNIGDRGKYPSRTEVKALVLKWLRQKETADDAMWLYSLLTDIDCSEWDWEWILFDRPSQELVEGESDRLIRLLWADRCVQEGKSTWVYDQWDFKTDGMTRVALKGMGQE